MINNSINTIKHKNLTRTGSILKDLCIITLYYLATNDLRKLNHELIPKLILKYDSKEDVQNIVIRWSILINIYAKEQRELEASKNQ